MKLKRPRKDNNSSVAWGILSLMIWFPMLLAAQGLKVKEMKPVLSDLSASVYQRQDSLGNPCGLVKVLIDNPNMGFGDDVVGEVDNKMNEYWVYLPKGTKKLIIRRSDYLPMSILFCDYGIDEIEAKVTYQLVLKETSINVEKHSLVVNIKPKNASLIIDGYKIDSNPDGSYRLVMEKGEHACRISAPGYRSALEVVNTGKGIQNLNIVLESLMAHVKINCGTTDADIFANDEKIGSGTWEGDLPSGSYVIEARKSGCVPKSLSISLKEKEVRTVTISELGREMLQLAIKSSPSDCFSRKVRIDGHFVGQDSISVTEVTSGTHQVEIEMTGCHLLRETVNINKSDTLEFYLSPINNDYRTAYEKNISACLKLVRQLNNNGTYDNKENEKESIYWGDKACQYLYESKDDILRDKWYEDQYNWEHLISIYLRAPDGNDKAHKLVDKIADSKIEQIHSPGYVIASSYYELGDYNSAIMWYQRLVKSASSDKTLLSDNYRKIGECYYEQKNYNKAIEFGKKAEQAFDGYIWSKYLLGNSYFNLGNKSNAIHWYREALKSCKDSDYAIRIILRKTKELGIYSEVTNGILNK